jgi:hypothetical protein
MEEPEPAWYCVDCGVRLRPEHEYCWNCGARRYRVPESPAAAATVTPARPARSSPVPGLAGARFFFAFWGVLLAVWATYTLALLLYYSTTASRPALAISGLEIAAAALLALLHAVAYHGVTGFRRGGWVVGVVVAGLWSLVLIGLPALYVMLLRSTREAFGLA